MKQSLRTRLRGISIALYFVAFVFIVALYYHQIIRGDVYKDKANHQYIRPSKVFDRGDIFLTQKDGTLITGAGIKSGYDLIINPKILQNDEEAYRKINAIVPIDHDIFISKSSKTNDTYEEISKHLDETLASKIEALKIAGVTLYKSRWRFYPGGVLAAHTIGIVSFNGDLLAGSYGLERYYNDILTRNDDGTFANFFAEAFSNVNKTVFKEGERSQGDIVLSIEPAVQSNLEATIAEIQSKYNSKLTGGIIINPNNGEIYALAITPTFDLNNFSKEKNASVFSNNLVEGVYEMGSIVKPLTMAAGIDDGVITANTTYDDKGFVLLNGKKISNHDHVGHGVVNMQKVLDDSLNTGVAFVVTKMGNAKFSKYMRAYGLGEETGIDLPNETHGLVDNILDSPRDVEHATASFGQGIAITPIETVRALSVLANGGHLITPHLVKQTKYTLGITKDTVYDDSTQVIKPETSKEISRMLTVVVDKALLNGQIKMDHYSIAAKTGTAQIVNHATNEYYKDKFLHSFFGYFPANNPKFLIFLYTIDPKGVEYASHTLTLPFSDLTKFIINYYQLPPDR
jgi:stage V sporulation protein D (sporulation-specific penicillin-binding protein)